MLKIGASSCAFSLTEESFTALREAGITEFEVSLHHTLHKELDMPAVRRAADACGVHIWSYHLPFSIVTRIDISSPDEEIRRYSVELWKYYISRAADVGVELFVAHPSSEPKTEPISLRPLRMEQSMRSLREVAEHAAREGAQIAVEDLPRTCLACTVEELEQLVSADDRLRVCFDTNHLLSRDNLRLVERLGDRIATLHVSDYDYRNERHWLPGEGDIDWQELYGAIIAAGYRGVWMYELGLQTPPSILRPRDLKLTDYVRNAEEIFRGRPLTAIGARVPGLPGWEWPKESLEA